MKLLYHYPNKKHFEKDIILNSTLLKMKQVIDTFLIDFDNDLSENLFFLNYILYKNGIREYNLDFSICNDDFIIVVKANKQSFFKTEVSNITRNNICKCGNKFISFKDVGEIFSLEEKYLCESCLVKAINKFVFNNIKKKNITNNHTINLGLSGERDSTLALFFLTKYREENNLKFKLICTYNIVGLGEYDSNRLSSAKKSFKKYCNEKDIFEINDVKVDMLNEPKNTSLPLSTYCNLCYRTTAFRKKSFSNYHYFMTASGGGTIEDQFMERIYNNKNNLQKYNVNYSFYDFTDDKNRVLPLKNLPEDILSLYSAINNIDFEVANCPISSYSAHYICRKNILNPLKAVSNWLYISHKESLETYNKILFNTLDYNRNPNYKFKVKFVNGNFIKVDNKSLKSVFSETFSKPHNLELEFFKSEKDSYYTIIEDNLKNWKIILNDKDLLNKRVFLNDFEYICKNGIIVCLEKKTDFIKTIPVNDLEQEVFYYILKRDKVTIKQILEYFSIEQLEIIKAIEYLRINYILMFNNNINQIEKTKDKKFIIVDEDKIFSEKEKKLIQELYKEIEFKNLIELSELNTHSEIIVYLSKNILIFLENLNYLREHSFGKNNIILIQLDDNLSIFAGKISTFKIWLNDKIKLMKHHYQKEIKKNIKLQTISILMDLLYIDNFEDNLQENEGILYYYNPTKNEKIKQLVKYDE